jgi:hypothetical protein
MSKDGISRGVEVKTEYLFGETCRGQPSNSLVGPNLIRSVYGRPTTTKKTFHCTQIHIHNKSHNKAQIFNNKSQSTMAQRKRAGLITRRTSDRNGVVLFFCCFFVIFTPVPVISMLPSK